MVSHYTAEIFSAFIYGAAGLIGGGFLFEAGKRYVKTAGSNQFKRKSEALPFFFSILVLGWILQHFDPVISNVVYSVPSSARVGLMVIGSMGLFNHSVDYFRYSDPKSVFVYTIGLLLIVLPSL